MSFRKIIQMLLPPIFLVVGKRLSNQFSISNNKRKTTIGQIERANETLIVIGNGPSLKKTFQNGIETIVDKDCIVVNHFCETAYYDVLKPKYYLLADPAYFGNLDIYADWLKKKIDTFINVFLAKTTWNINLIVPSYAEDSPFLEKVDEHSNIQVYYYNAQNYRNGAKVSQYELWDKNLTAPPQQTCLNTCVWLGIFLRYKNVYLIGADTNWLELLHVDQKTNEVYSIDTHFYGEKKVPLYVDAEGTVPEKLHEELNCIARTLSAYWDLNAYAEYAGVKVYNASEYSLIDAFERKSLYD